MLVRSETFERADSERVDWSEDIFQFCSFRLIDENTTPLESCYLGCDFLACRWYWGFFNTAVFVNCKFTGCHFDGCKFAGCKFVDCQFSDCVFGIDSFGNGCRFDENKWYGCEQFNCSGFEDVF